MTIFAVAAWITVSACVAMVGTLIVWLAVGRPSTEELIAGWEVVEVEVER